MILDIQLTQLCGNFLGVQQIQFGKIRFFAHAGFFRQLAQRIRIRPGIEALVIRVDTGINHRHPASGAGIACGIGGGASDHLRRGGHVRIRRLAHRCDSRLILGLQHHVFHALDGPDARNLTIGNIGGNEIGRQGQIPDHIQRLAAQNLSGNGLRQLFLPALQRAAIAHCRRVIRNTIGRISLYGRFLAQHNGDTDKIRILILRRGSLCSRFAPPRSRRRNLTVVQLLHAHAPRIAGRCQYRRDSHAEKQCRRQQHGEEVESFFVFHVLYHLCFYLPFYQDNTIYCRLQQHFHGAPSPYCRVIGAVRQRRSKQRSKKGAQNDVLKHPPDVDF